MPAAPRSAPQPVLVACSGGADSVALLGLLALLEGPERLALTVAHVDHALRPESEAEARLVTSLATQIGVAVRHRRLHLRRGPGLPARARAERRAALMAMASDLDAPWLALGHTRTDQAETVLLHLTRGAGTGGLGGMRSYNGRWWRPLLDLGRDETRALAERLALAFVDDPTNDDRNAPRTMVRHEVLPRLATINPGVERALATAADHAARAEDALHGWAAAEAERRRVSMSGMSAPSAPSAKSAVPADAIAGYDIADAGALPAEVRRRLIRCACQHAGIESDAVPARVVAEIDAALAAGGPARGWDLHPHTRVHLAGDRLWIERAAKAGCGDRGANH